MLASVLRPLATGRATGSTGLVLSQLVRPSTTHAALISLTVNVDAPKTTVLPAASGCGLPSSMGSPSTDVPFVEPTSTRTIWSFFSSILACVVETSLSLGRLIPFSRNFFPPDLPTKQAAAPTYVEINQCVGCTSGEEASPRHRAGVALMAWRTTR